MFPLDIMRRPGVLGNPGVVVGERCSGEEAGDHHWKSFIDVNGLLIGDFG